MKKILGILSATVLYLVGIIALYNKALFPLVDIPAITANPGVLHDRLNMIYNSFYVWRDSLTISALSNLISGFLKNPLHAPFVVSLTLIFSGAVTYLSRNSSVFKISSVFLAVSITACILLILGCDSLVFQSLSFSFWLLYFTSKFLKLDSVKTFNTLGFVTVIFLISETGNQFAFLTAAFCFAIAIFSENKINAEKRYCLIVTLFVLLLSTLYSPVPEIPDYPANSHLVPDDNIPGNIMPYIGPFPHIPVINRQGMKYFHFFPVAFLFIGALIAWSAFRKTEKKAHFLLFLTVCCMLDAFFPEYISVISPLFVIVRLIPGLFYIPILPLTIAFAVLTFAIVAADAKKHLFAVSAFLFLLSLFGSKLNINPILIAEPRDILASPSFYILSENGPAVLKQRDVHYNFRKPSINDFESIKASAHSDNEHFSNMFDGREKTRWSSGTGRQDGNEWITLNFKFERTIKGIYLNVGTYSADFPRGIEVEASVDCQNYFNIFQLAKWQGGIDFTKGGYPYYTSESDVRIFFENPIDMKCLKIKQVGKTAHFDWSIAELELIL